MKIVIYLYNGMTALDAIGPYEVLRNIKDAEIIFAARKKGTITADSQMLHFQAKHKIDDIEEADILLIPGSTVAFIKEAKNDKLLEWIRMIDQHSRFTTSVCTGSIILAASGLLKTKKATSHWKPLNMLKQYEAIPTKERMMRQGKYITAAGVSAGIDMAIYLVNEVEGETAAKAAQLAIEYDPQPMYDAGNVDRCGEDVIALAEEKMEEGAKKELSMWDILTNARSLRKLKNSE
ncbi:MAG: DJ-1/PfpI family protein [Bacteroidota bacterium]